MQICNSLPKWRELLWPLTFAILWKVIQKYDVWESGHPGKHVRYEQFKTIHIQYLRVKYYTQFEKFQQR